MDYLLKQIFTSIEKGKINRASPFPPELKDKDGADELTRQALKEGIHPSEILESGMISAMELVGKKFSRNEIFVPQMLMSAKAMNAALQHIKPYFDSGEAKRKGVFIIGTVAGDLHDIGKNLVAMMIEGGGWEVIDLGVDVKPEKFISVVNEHPASVVGLSALLTTTMENMKKTVADLKTTYPDNRVIIGGAPVTDDFRRKIGADFYSPDPQGAVDYLNAGFTG